MKTPLRLLRDHLKHIEEMKEKLQCKKKDIENQLDDVSFDLNEICSYEEEVRLSIKHLEGIIKK